MRWLMLQIITTLQLSVAMVHYPFYPLLPAFWDAFGQAFGHAEDAAAIQSLVDDPLLTAHTWSSLVSYVKAAESDQYAWGEYVPLRRHSMIAGAAVYALSTG